MGPPTYAGGERLPPRLESGRLRRLHESVHAPLVGEQESLARRGRERDRAWPAHEVLPRDHAMSPPDRRRGPGEGTERRSASAVRNSSYLRVCRRDLRYRSLRLCTAIRRCCTVTRRCVPLNGGRVRVLDRFVRSPCRASVSRAARPSRVPCLPSRVPRVSSPVRASCLTCHAPCLTCGASRLACRVSRLASAPPVSRPRFPSPVRAFRSRSGTSGLPYREGGWSDGRRPLGVAGRRVRVVRTLGEPAL